MLIIFHYYLHFKEEFIESLKISFLKNIYIYSKDFSFIIIRITLSANRKFCARYFVQCIHML